MSVKFDSILPCNICKGKLCFLFCVSAIHSQNATHQICDGKSMFSVIATLETPASCAMRVPGALKMLCLINTPEVDPFR